MSYCGAESAVACVVGAWVDIVTSGTLTDEAPTLLPKLLSATADIAAAIRKDIKIKYDFWTRGFILPTSCLGFTKV